VLRGNHTEAKRVSAMPKPENQTITNAVLAELTGRDDSFFRLHRRSLPTPTATCATTGRPAAAISLDDLAEFIWDRTNDLTDVQCRLIAALQPSRLHKPNPQESQS
jgi:hypothetical protein